MRSQIRLAAAALLVALLAVLGAGHVSCWQNGAYAAVEDSYASTVGGEDSGRNDAGGGSADLEGELAAAVTSTVFWGALAGLIVFMWLSTMLFSHLFYGFAGPDKALAAVKWATFVSVVLIGSLLATLYFELSWGLVGIALLSIPVVVLAFAVWLT